MDDTKEYIRSEYNLTQKNFKDFDLYEAQFNEDLIWKGANFLTCLDDKDIKGVILSQKHSLPSSSRRKKGNIYIVYHKITRMSNYRAREVKNYDGFFTIIRDKSNTIQFITYNKLLKHCKKYNYNVVKILISNNYTLSEPFRKIYGDD